jgi:leucyl/phenylalanyl-tRNA--protein transferase
LWEGGFELIDCQMTSPHLLSLGAREIAREEFLRRLRRGGVFPTVRQIAGRFPETLELHKFPAKG